MANIRLLTAREIECRVAQIKSNGLSLLLYKDARCDMAILDETFGPLNWQRHHSRDNANCIVSIWDEQKGQWIDKEDVGTESNTEAAKGLASDSFKRACVNIGIGRELYTAPFIWIQPPNCKIETEGGKARCYDRFEVSEIGYNEHREINRLVIVNAKNHNVVFQYGIPTAKSKQTPKAQSAEAPRATEARPATEDQKKYIIDNDSDEHYMEIMQRYGANLESLSAEEADEVIGEIADRLSDNPPKVVCERCGGAIMGVTLPDGTQLKANELVGKSKITYNGVYCFECMKALKRAKGKREAG